jgi:hypothetical protein
MFYSKSKMVLIGWIRAVSGDGRIIVPFTAGLALRVGAEFVLHPLIHTFLKINLAQDIEGNKKAKPDLVKARYQNSTLWAKDGFKS